MEVIEALRNEGFDIWFDGENIHCRLRDGVQPDKEKATRLLSHLKRRKAEAISFLEACMAGGELTVFSHVLGREIFVSWQGDNPETVLFDGVPYTIDEIAKLKKSPLTPEDLRLIHNTKSMFRGEIQ